jgi:3-methyladenine DNA glycosylase Mpg
MNDDTTESEEEIIPVVRTRRSSAQASSTTSSRSITNTKSQEEKKSKASRGKSALLKKLEIDMEDSPTKPTRTTRRSLFVEEPPKPSARVSRRRTDNTISYNEDKPITAVKNDSQKSKPVR